MHKLSGNIDVSIEIQARAKLLTAVISFNHHWHQVQEDQIAFGLCGGQAINGIES